MWYRVMIQYYRSLSPLQQLPWRRGEEVIGSKLRRMRTDEGWSGHCIMPGFSGFPVSSGRREENHRRSGPIRSHTSRHPLPDVLCQQVRTPSRTTAPDLVTQRWPFSPKVSCLSIHPPHLSLSPIPDSPICITSPLFLGCRFVLLFFTLSASGHNHGDALPWWLISLGYFTKNERKMDSFV